MFAQSLWSLAAAAFFSMMAACVKYCNDVFGPLELVFYRSLFTTLFVFITVSLRGETLKTQYPILHLRRDVLGFASVAIWFFTLGMLPLGTNITLTYSTPLFLALNFILLALWKKEQPEWPLIGSILLGFVGIVVVMRPSFLSGDAVPALLCLFVAFIDLFGYWQIRFLGRVHEPSWRVVFYYSLFCTVGALLGVLFFEDGFHMPNTRAAIAAFLSYGEAKRGSKHPEEFGNGSEEGLCAAETANNAVTGATLIPMLTLGIPGDSVTAVLMGALTIQGLTPGTELFVKHADMTYVVLVGFIIVQILMFYMGKLAIRGFSQITKIPYYILLPMVMAFCMVGSYSCSNNMTDILIAILFGLIGYIMPKFGFPTTPMLIGIVLGSLAEKNLVRTMAVYAGDVSVFFTRPISLLFLALSVVSVAFALLQKHRDKKKA